MVKENIGSFVAAVIASRAADFSYTVTVENSDDTAVGKQGRFIYIACGPVQAYETLPANTCTDISV